YEACAAPDAFYLISELVRGETLAQLIAADALDDERVLHIGIALADALAHAHARGVIHRDVKPQNVLVPHVPEAGPGASGPPLDRARGDLPSSLTRALDRALTPGACDRGTLDQLRHALEHALERVGRGRPGSARPVPAPLAAADSAGLLSASAGAAPAAARAAPRRVRGRDALVGDRPRTASGALAQAPPVERRGAHAGAARPRPARPPDAAGAAARGDAAGRPPAGAWARARALHRVCRGGSPVGGLGRPAGSGPAAARRARAAGRAHLRAPAGRACSRR